MILEGHFFWYFDLDKSSWYWSFMNCSSLVPDFLCFHVLFQQQSTISRGNITSFSGGGVSKVIAKLTSVTLCLKVSIVHVRTCMEEDVFRNVVEIEMLTDSATACDFATPRKASNDVATNLSLILTMSAAVNCRRRSTNADRYLRKTVNKYFNLI